MYLRFPLGGDQGILLWVGDVIRGGGLPYRDAFEIRGPGFDYLYALIVAVFGRTEWGIRLFDLMVVFTGAWLLARLGSQLAGVIAARAAAALFLLWYAALDYWHTAQSDGWTAVILAGSVAVLVAGGSGVTLRRAALAGALVACCALNKPNYAVFLLLPLMYCVAHRERGRAWVTRAWLATGAGFAVPIAIVVAWFAVQGGLDDLIEVHIVWVYTVYAEVEVPLLSRLKATLDWLLTGKFAVALPAAVGGVAVLWRTRPREALLLAAWPALALVNVFGQGKFWQYHWMLLYPPLALLTGVSVQGLVERWREPRGAGMPNDAGASTDDRSLAVPRVIAAAVVVLLFAGALFPPVLELYRWGKVVAGVRGREAYDELQYGPYGRGPNSFVTIARYIAARTTERDRVLVWGSVQGINFLSARRSPTRFATLRALTEPEDTRFRPKYLRELFDDLERTPPTYIVTVGEHACRVPVQSGLSATDHIMFPLRCPSLVPEFQRYVADRYAVERSFGNFQLLRRREQSA